MVNEIYDLDKDSNMNFKKAIQDFRKLVCLFPLCFTMFGTSTNRQKVTDLLFFGNSTIK